MILKITFSKLSVNYLHICWTPVCSERTTDSIAIDLININATQKRSKITNTLWQHPLDTVCHNLWNCSNKLFKCFNYLCESDWHQLSSRKQSSVAGGWDLAILKTFWHTYHFTLCLLLLLYQFNCHCNSTSVVTIGSIHVLPSTDQI